MKKVLVFVSLVSSAAFATDLKVSGGHVEFLAIGKPSAIKIRGKGDQLESHLQVKERTLSGNVRFDLGSLKTGIETRDEHMKEKYLEVAKYKDAELTLNPVTVTADICKGDAEVNKQSFEGTLKLHGTEQPVKGEFDIHGKKTQVRFDILISDYKIEIPTYMGIKVADKVENTVELDWSCVP